jgi:hypothetical protein
MRLQLEVVEQVDQPAPAVGGFERDRGAGWQWAKEHLELGGSLGRLRLRWMMPAWSPMATWERLRWTSTPTYTHSCGPASLRSSAPKPMAVGLSRGRGPTYLASPFTVALDELAVAM